MPGENEEGKGTNTPACPGKGRREEGKKVRKSEYEVMMFVKR